MLCNMSPCFERESSGQINAVDLKGLHFVPKDHRDVPVQIVARCNVRLRDKRTLHAQGRSKNLDAAVNGPCRSILATMQSLRAVHIAGWSDQCDTVGMSIVLPDLIRDFRRTGHYADRALIFMPAAGANCESRRAAFRTK